MEPSHIAVTERSPMGKLRDFFIFTLVASTLLAVVHH